MSDPTHKAMTVVERSEPVKVLHPLAEAMMTAMEKNPDPETMRQLLAVQREWDQDQARKDQEHARKAFSAAMVNLKRDLPAVISRDRVVDFVSAKGRTRYTHASLAHVLDQIEDALTSHGFYLTYLPTTPQAGYVSVTCKLTHSAGHSIESTMNDRVDDSGGKNHVQAIGSTITYLQRYLATTLLGIATADQPDADDRADEPAAPRVDTKRNVRVVANLARAGVPRQEAEAMVGRPADEWTAADADNVEVWARDHDAKPTEEAANGAQRPASTAADEAIDVIARAGTAAELEALAPGIKAMGLSGQARARVLRAYTGRREALHGGGK